MWSGFFMKGGYLGTMSRYKAHSLPELFERVSVNLSTQRGAPQAEFILHTNKYDEAARALRIFPLSLLPINLPMMETLPHQPGVTVPVGGRISIDFCFEDPDPAHIIYNLVIPEEQHDRLEQANCASNSLAIVLEQEKSGPFDKARSDLVCITYQPYLLDWEGILGIAFYVRNAWKTISRKKVTGLISALQERLNEHGPATGLYTELGYLYRLIENWDEAARCYFQEIKFGLDDNNLPGIGCVKALNNLGIVHKKVDNPDLAQACFKLALWLNPNYFETLVSLAGLLDSDLALNCVSRAYRVRPHDKVFPEVISNLAAYAGWNWDETTSSIEVRGNKIKLEKPLVNLTPARVQSLLKEIGIL